MMLPLVSVMIPCYNQSGLITRAIKSTRAQDYPQLEIIVSDDCSGDDTLGVAKAYAARCGDPRLRITATPANLGILKHYHHNLTHNARGDWVINLDGDDAFLDPGFISRAVALAMAHSDIVLVFADYAECDGTTGRLTPIRNRPHPQVQADHAFLNAYARGRIRWNHNSILYHRPTALKIGCYWDAAVLRNDWESFLRMVVGHHVGYLPIIASAWTQHGNNETARVDAEKYLRNFQLVAGVAEYAQAQGIAADFIERWQARMNIHLGRDCTVAYLRARDYTGLAAFLHGATRHQPGLRRTLALSPGLYVRALLAHMPRVYAATKRLVRR